MLEKKVSKLEELLSTFDDDTISLEVTFEKQARREEYYVSLTLSVPKKKLRSKDEGFDAFNAMNLAFDELLREVKKFYKFFGDRGESTIRDRIIDLFLAGFEETTKEQEG